MRILSILSVMGLVIAEKAYALPQVPTTMSVCGILPGQTCIGNGAAGASAAVWALVPRIEYIFYALAIGMFFYYSFRLMVESREDEIITETKSAYQYAIAGAIVVSLAGHILRTIDIGGAVVDSSQTTSAIGILIQMFRALLSIATAVLIVYQGIRVILSQGDQGQLDKQKKSFFHALVGVAIVLLAQTIVGAFTSQTGGSELTFEIVGIIRFLLEILGALTVLAFIVSGFLYIISAQESLKDRAKKTFFASLITMITVMVSYVLLEFTVNVTS